MSGGSFDYAYLKVQQFVDDLDDLLGRQDEVNEWGEKPYLFGEHTVASLQEVLGVIRDTAALMKAVEYLYSGDISEETFLERIWE